MIDFNELAIFVEVVEAGNFTAAARRLGLPKSNVSRKISLLEVRLQTRLLHRTTRAMGLTEAGRLYYEHCRQVVEQARAAEELVSGLQSVPAGTLRVSAPVAVGADILPPLVNEFLAIHAQVNIELVLTDEAVDLLQQDLDLALSANPAPSSTYISRRLGYAPRIICASRQYVDQHGGPSHPDELAAHDLLAFSSWLDSHRWSLRRGGEEKRVNISARYAANDVPSVLATMLDGLGVAMLPEGPVLPYIESGEALPLLADWQLKADALYLHYPSRSHLAPKLRAFIDFLMEPGRAFPGLAREKGINLMNHAHPRC